MAQKWGSRQFGAYAPADDVYLAAALHDIEIARMGRTSEDVKANLGTGAFGMVGETGAFMNAAMREGARWLENMAKTKAAEWTAL